MVQELDTGLADRIIIFIKWKLNSQPKNVTCKISKKLLTITCDDQWRNDAPGAPATPGGAVLRGRQIVIKCGTILQD